MELAHTEKVFVKKGLKIVRIFYVRFSLFPLSYLDVKRRAKKGCPAICLIAKSMNNSANLKQQSPK